MSRRAVYTFQRRLGAGGYGEVYLATRTSTQGLSQRVAVKLLRPDLPQPHAGLARLRDEAALLALVDHPVVVRVLELTSIGGRVALVTEYVAGEDLSYFTNPAARLSDRGVAEVCAKVAGALHDLYHGPHPETGVPLRLIHRDIKPSNLRLSRRGEVKLLDFGIARAPDLERWARTQTGRLPLTLGYTPPEAFTSLAQGPPSDVFALGVTLFRLLTGERLYARLKLAEQAALARSPSKYAQYVGARLERLVLTNGGLADLVRCCLAYDPAARLSAAMVEEAAHALAVRLPGPDLQRWLVSHPPPKARPTDGSLSGRVYEEDAGDLSTEVSRWPRRPSVAAWLWAGVTVVLIWALGLALTLAATRGALAR
jgi:serine/threonine protein kinase